MAFISDLDRTAFENLCKGIHEFTAEELEHLHELAEEVNAIVRAAIDRQQKRMAAH